MPVLKQTLEIDAPPQEVWRVLTTPELVREWAAAYQEGISIRTSWREGERVTWKSPDGGNLALGVIAAFRPERLLKFEYTEAVATENRSFSEAFEISAAPTGTVLSFTSGPLDEVAFEALKGPAANAIREIKSLAEESAQIHGLR